MGGGFYRAIWRWHSWAGIIVLPILGWMAVTGGLYLYKNEIERALYHDWIVLPVEAAAMPVTDMIRAVEFQTHGHVVQVARPAATDEAWRMTFEVDGERRMAFVQPWDGAVRRTTRDGGPMEVLKELHSLAITGPIGNALTEIAAGWAIILVLTGFYLWWPRAGSRALSLVGRVGERRFWRNLHASTGALAGLVILFLAVTGMPWTQVWGGWFHGFVANQQIGRPRAPGAASGGHEGHEQHLPWTMRGQPVPAPTGGGDIGPDRAIAAAQVSAPWILDLPEAGRPYRISAAITRAQDAHLVYVNPADGIVLQNVRGSDFGIGAQAFEWGIYTHQGEQYGEANRLVMLAGCIGMVLLVVSAPVMWWKRRRAGRALAEPPGGRRGVAIIMLAVGALFPLTGATMLAALLFGFLARSRPAPMRAD